MATVTVERLSKSFTHTDIVRDVSFTVNDGCFLTLLGPSGCGKSTILRLIAGLEEISSGEIRIDGQRVNDRPPAERDIAMVFQSYALYPHMTCYENIAVSLRLRRLPASEIKRRVETTAELLGIAELLARKPKQLSGGQRQRIALGRAIVRQPKVMLLDEPLSNLDAQLRERMRTELKRLFIEMGATVIYVTHDQSEAMSMSNTIVMLKDGVLQQQDTPSEIYRAPANLFVAGFLGSPRINLIPGRLAAGQFVGTSFTLPIGRSTHENVLLGVRPEHITVASEARTGAIAGRVELLEPLGLHTKVVVQVGTETLSALSNDPTLKLQQPVWLDFNPSQLLLFDTTTEQLINN
ncbi:MAG: ABC transporter ATP-binding protein [Acidobacteriota bacterium]